MGCDIGKKTMKIFINKLVCTVVAIVMTSSFRLAASTGTEEVIPEPEFAEVIPNVTVIAGRDVSLPCVVDNLGTFRVAWIHTDRYTLLTLQNRVITRNPRLKVTHISNRTWTLHITDVQKRDKGEYMCQINTTPMKTQTGYIEVVVPPGIEEDNTSSDTEVREGSDVSLRCVANGSPEPEITWRREDNQEITIDKKKVTIPKGPYLNITNVDRLHMGAYLCIASNGVEPSVRKRIVLNVNFITMIWIPKQLVGAPVDTDVSLDCNLETFPQSVTYWKRDCGTMVLTNDKYKSEVLTTSLYKVTLRLTIRNLKPEDFGSYTCVAKNSLGSTEGTIRLYDSTEIQYGPSLSLNDSRFSSENCSSPTNLKVRPASLTVRGPTIPVVAGEMVTLTCTVEGARPAANITWYNRSEVIKPQPSPSTDLMSDGAYRTSSSLVLVASRYDHKGEFLCKGINEVLEAPLLQATTLEVLYKPAVFVSPDGTVIVQETSTVNITCVFDANPPDVTEIVWYKDGNSLQRDTNQRLETRHSLSAVLTLYNVSRHDSGIYTCHVRNPFGRGNATTSAVLNVLCADSMSSAATNILYACSYYVIYFITYFL